MFPGNRCPPLEDVENGSWQLVTSDRVFGAVARYACEAGFVLSGPAERVCRADGKWSGTAPTCETEGGRGYITISPNTFTSAIGLSNHHNFVLCSIIESNCHFSCMIVKATSENYLRS